MNDPKIMYRAFFGFQSLSLWHPDSPVPHFFTSMELSACGQYVQVRRRRLDDQGWETLQQSISDYWQPTKEQALAVAAPRLRAIGLRLIEQALEFERAAKPGRGDAHEEIDSCQIAGEVP